VRFGNGVRLAAHLGSFDETISKVLKILATPYGGTPTLVRSGEVNASGDLTARFVPTRKTTFVATFPGDDLFKPATSKSKTVQVIARVTGKLSNFDAKSGKYKLYRYTADCTNHGRGCPRYTAKVAPNHHGKRVSFILQLFADGSWHTVLSFRDRLNARSMRTEIFVYRNARIVGFPTRVRVMFEGDADHLGDSSEWNYFKVVR
jgi:hypothetical protein